MEEIDNKVLENKNLDKGVEDAGFKFSLIAPMLYNNHGFRSENEYIRHVIEVTKRWPDGSDFNVGISAIKKWKYQYRHGGFDALLPEKRSDSGSWRKLSVEAQKAIRDLKKERPKLNAKQIYKELENQGLADAGLRTVQRFVKALKTEIVANGDGKVRRAFQFPKFGMAWQCDTQHIMHITVGGVSKKIYCMQIIDDCTRMIVGGGIFFNDNTANFQIALKDAIFKYGIPQMIMVDNGSNYYNAQNKLICGELGIILANSNPYDPQFKGKVERINGIFQQEVIDWMDASEIHSLETANDIYWKFVDNYNNRMHGATGKIPCEHMRETRAEVRVVESMSKLNLCFMNRVSRTVRNDNTVQINKVDYDVPGGFVGQTVEIRFRVNDMTDAIVLAGGKEYPLVRTDKEAHAMERLQYFLDRANGAEELTAPRTVSKSVLQQSDPDDYAVRKDLSPFALQATRIGDTDSESDGKDGSDGHIVL